jgi:hypothetical protein
MTSVSTASGQTRPSQSVAVRIILVMCGLAVIVLIRYSPRLALVHAGAMDYLAVAITAVAVVFALVGLRGGLGLSATPSLRTLAFWFVVAAAGVNGVFLLANARLDPGPSREFTTLAASEHCGTRNSTIVVKGAPTLPAAGGTMRVNVGRGTCRSTRDGDTIVVVIGPGYFGRAWVQDARLVQGASR